jgi:hypothetical protein
LTIFAAILCSAISPPVGEVAGNFPKRAGHAHTQNRTATAIKAITMLMMPKPSMTRLE